MFLVPRTLTRSIFAAWQPLRMSRRSWAVGTDFKTRVLRLKPEVQILGSTKSIHHTKVEIKTFSTEFFCPRPWWFHIVLFNDLRLVHKLRPWSSSVRPAMPFVKQEPLVLKFLIFEQRSSKGSEPFSLLICHDAKIFVLLSVFTVIERICQNSCSKSRLKSEQNVHYWLTCVAQAPFCLVLASWFWRAANGLHPTPSQQQMGHKRVGVGEREGPWGTLCDLK